MTVNEALGNLISTLTFWHIIAFIAVIVAGLIVHARVANLKKWHFKEGFEYYPDGSVKTEIKEENKEEE